MGEGFPLWSLASMAWEGRESLRDWICLFVSLCFCVPYSAISPFLKFPGSVTQIGLNFGHDFYPDNSFLAEKEGHQPPYGVATRAQGAPYPLGGAPHPRGPLGHRLALIPLPKIHIYSKTNLHNFYPVWTLFDMDFLQTKKHATNRNWHWALDQYVSPKIV